MTARTVAASWGPETRFLPIKQAEKREKRNRELEGKMKTAKRFCWMVWCALVLVCVLGPSAKAQNAEVRSRVVAAVDDTQTVRLHGNMHPLARSANDQGALADSQPLTRMLLLLQRSAEQEVALRQLMDAQQTKGSGTYHAWLTPAQFGKQYGPSDADVQAVTDWLTKQGFQVSKVAAGRTAIEFSGNVGQVRNAFHTEIHRYVVNGEEHFANASDPAIPAALAPVVAGVVSLHNFPKKPLLKNNGVYRRIKDTGQLMPLFTFGSPTQLSFAMGPGDFVKIYNVPLSGADGTGQSIAIVGQSNINIQDIRDFRSMFGLPANDPQIIVNGPDPGILGPSSTDDESESDLDVEWAGAAAPGAQIILVTSQSLQSSTTVSSGIDLSALYIVDNNLAPVMSESYGACEPSLGTVGNAFYNALWQQASAQGITVVVSTGDAGSADCDPTSASPNAAIQGLAVNGISSTIYNVAVGGTDFDASTMDNSAYWNLTSGTINSALKYIPETTWDDSPCAANYPTACTNVDQSGADVSAAGGGPSLCATGSGSSCVGYPKPAYQIGITPATAGFTTRLQPDVSLFASNGQNGVSVVVCQSDVNPSGASCNLNSPYQDFLLVGGTSAATPPFAAIMALVNQKTGERQGNPNYVLYGLAAADTNYTSGKCNSSLPNIPAASCVFNDVAKGNNSVACVASSPNCSNTASAGFGIELYQSSPAFVSTAGYDLATGLGSVNVTNLLNSWGNFTRATTTTALSNASSTTNVSGQTFNVTVTVTSSSGTPSGSVSLIALAADGKTVPTAGAIGPFTLASNGSVVAPTNLLPPGTASIEATYSGDATHALSTSAPLAVAVSGANQPSKTTLSFVTFDANGNPILSTSPPSQPYGAGVVSYILQIAVTNSAGTLCANGGTAVLPAIPCPTGTITLTDGSSPLKDFNSGGTANATATAKLNNIGMVEDQQVQLAVGSHSIVAAFAPGDSNYQASSSNTLNITVTKATTTMTVVSSPSSITKGMSVTLTATVNTTSAGVAPTGSVQFSNGGTSLGTAMCMASNATASTPASCTATLTTTISALYPPPGIGPGTRGVPLIPLVMALVSAALFALGWRWMPAGRRRAYAYTGLIAFALLAAGIAGCGGGGSGSGPGTRTINAVYPGDTNYAPSNSSTPVAVM